MAFCDSERRELNIPKRCTSRAHSASIANRFRVGSRPGALSGRSLRGASPGQHALGVSRMKRRILVSLIAATAVALLALGLAPIAEAAGLKAQVYLVQAKIPQKLSEKGLIGFARANANKLLRENTDAPVKERKWQ